LSERLQDPANQPPQIRHPTAEWAIIAYGMVSIWLTKVKGVWPKTDMKKIGLVERGRFASNAAWFESALLAILLNAGGAQPGKAMLIDGKLPGEEFVDGQRVAAASLLEGEQTAAYSGNDFGLTANDPPFGSGRGQIRNRQRSAVRPDDCSYARARVV